MGFLCRLVVPAHFPQWDSRVERPLGSSRFTFRQPQRTFLRGKLAKTHTNTFTANLKARIKSCRRQCRLIRTHCGPFAAPGHAFHGWGARVGVLLCAPGRAPAGSWGLFGVFFWGSPLAVVSWLSRALAGRGVAVRGAAGARPPRQADATHTRGRRWAAQAREVYLRVTAHREGGGIQQCGRL